LGQGWAQSREHVADSSFPPEAQGQHIPHATSDSIFAATEAPTKICWSLQAPAYDDGAAHLPSASSVQPKGHESEKSLSLHAGHALSRPASAAKLVATLALIAADALWLLIATSSLNC